MANRSKIKGARSDQKRNEREIAKSIRSAYATLVALLSAPEELRPELRRAACPPSVASGIVWAVMALMMFMAGIAAFLKN